MTLNVEAVKELIFELRSGEWKPGRYKLRTEDDEYCCLGIACEIAVHHGVIPPATIGSTVFDGEVYTYGTPGDRAHAVLPESVREWYGFESHSPWYGNFAFTAENDAGVSQRRIADQFELMLESDQSGV